MNNYDLAENPNTSSTILEKLANDEYSIVRRRVVLNPNTPEYILLSLYYE